MKIIKDRRCLPPTFSSEIIKGILSDDKDLKIEPKFGYSKYDGTTYILGLKISVQENNTITAKTYTSISEWEYDIEAISTDAIANINSVDFFNLFSSIYLMQINATIDFLNEKLKTENLGKLGLKKMEDVKTPIQILLSSSPLN